jgi:hypothetical protein
MITDDAQSNDNFVVGNSLVEAIAVFESDDIVYAEQELAATIIPTDRINKIEVARTARETYLRLKEVEKMLVNLISSEQPCVAIKYNGEHALLMLNIRGRCLASSIQNFPFTLVEGKTLSCRLDIFMEVINNLGGIEGFECLPVEHRYLQTTLKDPSFQPKCRAGFVLRAALDLRKIGNSRSFKARLTKAKKESEETLKKLVGVVQNLFLVSSKLLVIRVDFEYLLNARSLVTIRSAKRDMRKFLNNIRHQTQFADLLGHIWAVEEGLAGGIHFHCFFFFKGHEAQRDVFYSMALGKYWVKVTEGRGAFHSCNAKKGSYLYRGIGMVSHSDLEKHSGLLLALAYFTAADKAQSIPFERSFGHSKPHTPPPESLGGRKRTPCAKSVFTRSSNDDELEGRND